METLHTLGHEVDGIFGINVPANKSLRQATFFHYYQRLPDLPLLKARSVRSASRTKRVVRAWRNGRDYLRAFVAHRSREVPRDSDVLTNDGVNVIPAFDRIFTTDRLFDDAMFVFARTGRFSTFRVPNPPEIMHWTYPVPVKLAGSRNIYTLHDLVPLKLPYTTLDDKTLYGSLISGCLKHAAQICTVSEASKCDIIDRYDVDATKVTNTYQTATVAQRLLDKNVDQNAQDIESIFGLERRGYFLFFGAIEPKKNIGRLIEAFLSLRTKTPLVIVGARAWQSERELQLMPGGGASGAAGTFVGPRDQTIIRIDYLSRVMLAKLTRGAKAVVFPSLYEGFGLPVLEAMQLGTPVITSNTSSLPEVAGGAGLLVDPYDVDSLVKAMRRLDRDEALCAAMAARGLEQARLFSRERYGERLTELYRAAMASQ
ncbi:glycosyltransferase family 4 protein [Sphingomonas bacterium]|uniref:glycosyltransferase family 4 protein n=1 Tax=Sphingomonas bacterium TaxID=1895847 RepID=UPI00266F98B9|nr:glycosyltransferase family 1 protein [Sphingomonas bacterium]